MRDNNSNEACVSMRSSIDKNVKSWLHKKFNKGNVNTKQRLDKQFLEIPHSRAKMISNSKSRAISRTEPNSRNISPRQHLLTENEENCILQLPKLPFGIHSTYNSDEHFT